MSMNARSLLLASTVITLFLASGCGSPSSKGDTPREQPTSRPMGVGTSAAPTQSIPAGIDFGAGVTRSTVDDFTAVYQTPSDFAGRPLLVRAEVMDVCKTKGCWIKVTDGTNQARVKFHDYSFFLPKDCEGKTAWIEGVVTHKVVPVDVLKHYAAESGTENPDDITEPLTQVQFVATGVRLTDQ